jgi:leucyl aminopeptidase (aminopeptidase T)
MPKKKGDEMEMVENAKGALESTLKLREGENVLVVIDREHLTIGAAFHKAAEEIGAISEIFILPEGKRPLYDVPPYLSEMLEGRDVLVNALASRSEETPFRVKLIKAGIAIGARIGHGPGITESMMTEGPMSIDFGAVAQIGRSLMASFDKADEVHVTAPAGTDLRFSIGGRDFQTDMEIEAGHMGNLPPGEIWCAPVEDSAEGIVVSDGSVGDLGAVPSPLSIRVGGGKITGLSCDDAGFLGKVKELTSVDEMASVIGEFGIGINPKARITGNLLEDEKAGRTAHIAFGNNETMPGGKNGSKTHRDFLFHRPTIEVRYADGLMKTVMKEGDLVA